MPPRHDGGAVTAYDRIAAGIRERILSGDLRPGDQLPTPAELSSQHKVSHNTAREALLVLASQGLLTLKRGVTGGTFVTVPRPEQVSGSLQTALALLAESAHVPVSALLEVREMLEVPAAELAALRRTENEMAEIRKSLSAPLWANPGGIYSSTHDFHARVLRAAHNPSLEMVAEPVFGVLRDRILRERAPERFWQQVDRDHHEILGYLEARDQAGAREATRAHLRALRATYESFDRVLASEPRPS